MDLILYHYQGIYYFFVFVILMGIRVWLNMVLYHKVDSHIIHPNVPDYWKFISFSEKEKEDLRKKYPNVRDFSKDGSSAGSQNEENLHYLFTFWWTSEYQEDLKITRIKRIANIFHISFIILFAMACILYLHMQELNVEYEQIERDWLYIFRSK